MTQEEKAKAYDKIVDRAKKEFNACGSQDCDAARQIFRLFPELKESEDERIRKEIIDYLSTVDDKELIPYESWISWLEKQGEQEIKEKPIWKHWKNGIAGNGEGKQIYLIKSGDSYTLSSCLGYECDYIELSELNRLLEKQGKQKPIKFKVGQTIKKEGFNLGFTIVKIEDGFYYNDMGDYFPFTDQDNWELVEQKPVKEQIFPKWTDEEEFYIVALEGLVKDRWRKAEQENDDFNVKKMSDLLFFLKTLKKPEWSEEDNETLDRIISNYQYFCKELSLKEGLTEVEKEVINKVDKEDINWLKSLKERVRPQPKTEWSKEDELNIRELESLVKQEWAIAERENDKDTIHKMSDLSFFLKTLKPQPQKEWSEKDENILNNILFHLKDNLKDNEVEFIAYKNWLISLRPQNRWKPSDEQMDNLHSLIYKSTFNKELIVELYVQLKAL